MITPEKIARVFEAAKKNGAASLAEPINDTLKRADPAVAASAEEAVDLTITESVDRRGIYGMQTPQVFERKLLEKAYDIVANKKISVTDEVSAVELLGHKIVLVPNYDFNFKVTYPRDLPLAEFVLRQRSANE